MDALGNIRSKAGRKSSVGSKQDVAEAMLRLEKEGFDIVCHVHDEVVLEVPDGKSSVEEVNEIMAVNPVWTEGLPLKAAGFESPFYKKD